MKCFLIRKSRHLWQNDLITRQEDFQPVAQMKTKRHVFFCLLKEFLVLDQLWSVYTKYILEAVHLIKR